jgi:hypothetical protein
MLDWLIFFGLWAISMLAIVMLRLTFQVLNTTIPRKKREEKLVEWIFKDLPPTPYLPDEIQEILERESKLPVWKRNELCEYLQKEGFKYPSLAQSAIRDGESWDKIVKHWK